MGDWNGRAHARRMAEDCGAFRARHLARVLTRLYDDALRPHGVSLAQLEILASAAGRGQVPIAQVAEDTGAERSTTSRNVRSMVEAGLLRAERTATGRTRYIALTEQGRGTFAEAYQAWAAMHEKTRTIVGEDGIAAMEGWIERLEGNDGD